MSIKQSGHDHTPLHFGATFGMINLYMHVLSKISPYEKHILLQNGARFTPLHISAARGYVEVARLLFSAMDKLSTMIPDDLLHIALRREDDATVKLLVFISVSRPGLRAGFLPSSSLTIESQGRKIGAYGIPGLIRLSVSRALTASYLQRRRLRDRYHQGNITTR
jgi:hypothetical protein